MPGARFSRALDGILEGVLLTKGPTVLISVERLESLASKVRLSVYILWTEQDADRTLR